jgi:RNA methyltransferase, TrmH family
MKIISFQNEKFKNILKLKKNRQRKKQDLIIIEGRKEIESALEAGWDLEDFFYCPDLSKSDDLLNQKNYYELDKKLFAKISYRESPDGFLATAKPRYLIEKHIKLNKNPLIAVMESVEKPGNLGAVLRTCDALAIDLLICNDLKTDIYNPNVIRASRGAVFTVPLVLMSFESSLEFLKKHKIKSFAAALQSEKNYIEVDFSSSAAIIFGSEDSGLTEKWLQAADEKIKIPMEGKIDSLNVSVAAAVMLFEAKRQRIKKILTK